MVDSSVMICAPLASLMTLLRPSSQWVEEMQSRDGGGSWTVGFIGCREDGSCWWVWFSCRAFVQITYWLYSRCRVDGIGIVNLLYLWSFWSLHCHLLSVSRWSCDSAWRTAARNSYLCASSNVSATAVVRTLVYLAPAISK